VIDGIIEIRNKIFYKIVNCPSEEKLNSLFPNLELPKLKFITP
jgi:hypothetical protein